MNQFKVITNKNNFKIDYYYEFIGKDKIKVNKDFFSNMCKKGCKNYNKKYSCPPFSPSFKNLSKSYDGLFIIFFLTSLKQIKSTEYNKIRIANVVMKSKIKKLMRYLEEKFDTKFLSTGSCDLCKPCKCKLKLSCKYPEKRRYSLEAVGIDCNKLSEDIFKRKLLWYKDKKAPDYTTVMCGLLCNKKDIRKIEEEIKKYLLLI